MNTLVHDDTIWSQNDDGTWSEAVPLPYRRSFIRKACWTCGEGFFLTSSYEWHYRSHHTDGLAYIRKPEGFLTSYRLCRGIHKELPESLIYRGPATSEATPSTNQVGEKETCGICGDGGHTAFACPNQVSNKENV